MSTLGMGQELLFLNPREVEEGLMYKDHGGHILVVGITGSGKTATLLKLMYNLWKFGETVIWRDDQNLEFLSIAKIAPIKLYQPRGCDLILEDRFPSSICKNIEKAEYDWRRPEEVIPTLSNERINVLLFELFSEAPALSVRFWVDFFHAVKRWKQERLGEPWALVYDEFNDLAAGERRGTFEGHLRYSSRVYYAMKKFRKLDVRLVATTHNYNDIHFPVRMQFKYYLFKQMHREAVPGRFRNFASLFEKMRPNHCIIVDPRGNYQHIQPGKGSPGWTLETRWHLDPSRTVRIIPRRYKVPWRGEVADEDAARKGTRAQQWKDRTLLLLRVIDRLGVPMDYKAIGGALDLSKSYSHELRRQADELPQAMVDQAVKAVAETIM